VPLAATQPWPLAGLANAKSNSTGKRLALHWTTADFKTCLLKRDPLIHTQRILISMNGAEVQAQY
jgi:hypothetical protein